MATDVLMPQMGESIAEGTVSRWIKKVGDKVERDEPLLEISTDKVDAEIPSPTSGTLAEILVKEGETVAVNSVVARIAAEGESASAGESAGTCSATSSSGGTRESRSCRDRRTSRRRERRVARRAPPYEVLAARPQDR